MADNSNALALDPRFLTALGFFHSAWVTGDLAVEFGIMKFLNVEPAVAHLITQGMMFGRKSQLLRQLVKRSSHPKKREILTALRKISEGKRDAIAHGFLRSSAGSVTFHERTRGGELQVKELKFTLEEFVQHTFGVSNAFQSLNDAIGIEEREFEGFALAASSLSSKSAKSPGNPDDR